MRPIAKRTVPTRKAAAKKARRRKSANRARAAETECLRLRGCIPTLAAVVAGACATCGQVPDGTLHVPLRQAHAFCSNCCPVCNGPAAHAPKATKHRARLSSSSSRPAGRGIGIR